VARLYLVRHAQSENNVIWDGSDNHTGRSSDPEITELGHRQAETLGRHLAHPQAEPRQHPFNKADDSHFGLTHVYCSLMTRSILTAEYIAAASNLGVEALANVFEKNGIYDVHDDGSCHGLSGPGRSYFKERFPGLTLPQEFNGDGWWSRSVEDESGFLQRMQEVVSEIRQRLTNSNDNIALVAHGDFIDQFVNELMNVVRHQPNYDNHWVANWTFHNTSISRIDFVDGSNNVVYLNRIDHLPNELVTW
jgi:2,3-bisphosphoglycerate-dependent phosphoglycerate mutase